MKQAFLFTNKILRELDNMKILIYKFSVQYLVVKFACVNAAQETVHKGCLHKIAKN